MCVTDLCMYIPGCVPSLVFSQSLHWVVFSKQRYATKLALLISPIPSAVAADEVFQQVDQVLS